jgi:hypothetical protein
MTPGGGGGMFGVVTEPKDGAGGMPPSEGGGGIPARFGGGGTTELVVNSELGASDRVEPSEVEVGVEG